MEETELLSDGVNATEEATSGAEEPLVPDDESDPSESTEEIVSRRGRPRDLGTARMYSKGFRWLVERPLEPIGLTRGQKMQSCGTAGPGILTLRGT